MLQDPADVGQEAHVEHPVGLVEDQHLEVVEPRVRETEVVEEAARRRDDHVHAGAEGVLLGTHADAAEDGGRRERRVHRQRAGVLVDLRGELAGRRQDQGAGDAALLPEEAVQDGQDEGRRLAAPRHRAGEHVAPFEGGRDGVGLDRRGTVKAELLDAAQERRVELEGSERHRELSVRKGEGGCHIGPAEASDR